MITSPPAGQSSPAQTRPMPCDVDDVRATSLSAAPRERAAAARARARRPSNRSMAALPIRGSRMAATSADIASIAACGMGPFVPAFR